MMFNKFRKQSTRINLVKFASIAGDMTSGSVTAKSRNNLAAMGSSSLMLPFQIMAQSFNTMAGDSTPAQMLASRYDAV